MKKVLDQTVREFKREVNKVLKVPEIEQKVLDATSNEAWGPHGTVMADIAQATRNYNDYQMVMSIIWKRINDTGRNWRHVYKALTLLEFLVAHGSERVIDELREHAHQISTLADFQYIDSSGKDQGQNVRKKSQNLVSLVNDKEKIREARQKAVENRDKYRGVSSTGGIYKPSSYHSTGGSYGGDRYEEESYGRYGGRDDDRYGRDRDGDRYRDDDRYGRDGDRNGRDSDRSSRGGDRYRDDYNRDYDQEDDRYSSRRGDDRQSEKYRSFEKDRDRAYDDDDRHSSRSGGGRGDDYGPDDRRADRKPSDARMHAPPSYEEALGSPDNRASEERRDGGGLAAAVARASRSNTGQFDSVPKVPPASSQIEDFDEFDPRASSVAAAAAAPLQVDRSFSQEEPVGAVRALLPPPSTSLSSALSSSSSDLFADSGTSSFAPAPAVVNGTSLQQLDGDIFGDSPFKVETSTSAFSNFSTALAPVNPPPSFTAFSADNGGVPLASAPVNPPPSFPTFSADNGGALAAAMGSNGFNAFAATPPSVPSQAAPASFDGGLLFGDDFINPAFGAASNGAPPVSSPFQTAVAPQGAIPSAFQVNQAPPTPMANPQPIYSGANQAQQGSLYTVSKPQPQRKFETKSTVWADTLSKGLIDLNIGGPKANPLADIGIDFDLLRTERIKEERTSTKTSTINMGKAMGSGSGLGLAGASAVATPAPVMMNGMGMAPGMGMTPMGMGMTPPMGMGMTPPMGMGMRPTMGPGMGMASPMLQMGLNPGMPVRPNMGMGPGMGMGMGMNSGMGMGMGVYPNQQQYSGYR
eukprot:c7258_g1_i1 orf=354-2777(-)